MILFILCWNQFTCYISGSPDHLPKHNKDPGFSESSLILVNVYRPFIDHYSVSVTCFLSLCSLLNAQCSTLNAQCLTLNAQCSMLNAQCSMLNAQCSMLNAQRSMLNAHCSMLNAQCSMLNAQFYLLRCTTACLVSAKNRYSYS